MTIHLPAAPEPALALGVAMAGVIVVLMAVFSVVIVVVMFVMMVMMMLVRDARVFAEDERLDRHRHRERRHPHAPQVDVVEVP
jgi:hypothetical protein